MIDEQRLQIAEKPYKGQGPRNAFASKEIIFLILSGDDKKYTGG